MIYKIHIQLVHVSNMAHVSNTMWKSKNLPSNLLLVVTMPYARWFLWRVDCIEDFK